MLASEGWINGIVASVCFIFAFILGIGIIYQGRKSGAKLLSYMGVSIFFSAFFWIIACFDFFSILFFGINLTLPTHLMGIITFFFSPLITIISMYIGGELLIPEKKKIILLLFLILGFIFELIIFLNPNDTFYISIPIISGTDIIYVYFNSNNFVIILLYFIFSFSGFIFLGFGYFIKSIHSKAVIKKKFFFLSLGYFLFLGFPLIRSLILRVGFIIPIYYVRIGMVSSFFFFYYGLRVEPEEKLPKKEEVKIAQSLFRLYERPSYITEEEVILHKERNICLVCKNKVLRVSYICPKCNALYCKNCSEELSDLENSCWVCNEPFDETKPTKKFPVGKIDDYKNIESKKAK